jgi:hypothetical protein
MSVSASGPTERMYGVFVMAVIAMAAVLSDGQQPMIASLGVVASFLGLIVTLCVFAIQQRRLEKVRKQEIYQRLELASNDLFRFTAGNAPVLAAYGSMEKDPGFEPTAADSMVADNHIFQTLNLFEMAARLRYAKVFEDEVFGSWVIWYYELLGSWYFRDSWTEIRPNYTSEIRRVFDRPVREFDPRMDDDQRRRQFFAHVARELGCPRVKTWLDE